MQSAVKRYYNINKFFVSRIGGWPTQRIFTKILFTTLLATAIFSVGCLEFVQLTQVWRNLFEDCESFIILILVVGAYIKMYSVIGNKNIKRLLSLIDYHWHIFTHSLEVEIMHNYALVSNKMTVTYAVTIYSLMCLFMMLPLMPQILDIIMPLNESRPYHYLFNYEYSFDREKYYYSVLAHSYVVTVWGITMMIAVDSFYMLFAQHACSLFAAVGYRLENLTCAINTKKINQHTKYEFPDYYVQHNEDDDEIYRELILILRKHQISIEYAGLLESSFALTSFVLLFLNIMVTTLVGIQMLSLLDDRKEDMVRFGAMFLGAFAHIFILSYPGQRIMDHSADIFYKAYNVEWYNLSRKSTQLLSILLYRSNVPCTLTAGKMYVLCMANYASVVQTSLSYFTAISSIS